MVKPFTLPNLITGSRILAAPVIIYLLINQSYYTAFLVFFIAGFTDWADGFSARFYNAESELGRVFDPLADKVLIASVYTTLAMLGEMPWWLATVVVGRDLLILTGAFCVWYFKLPLILKPLYISKVNTLFQILLCLTLLAKKAFLGFPLSNIFFLMLFYGTLITTVWSGVSYAKLFLQSTQR